VAATDNYATSFRCTYQIRYYPKRQCSCTWAKEPVEKIRTADSQTFVVVLKIASNGTIELEEEEEED
jgi:hypothetical protein